MMTQLGLHTCSLNPLNYRPHDFSHLKYILSKKIKSSPSTVRYFVWLHTAISYDACCKGENKRLQQSAVHSVTVRSLVCRC